MKIIKSIQTRKTNRVFFQEIKNVDFNDKLIIKEQLIRVNSKDENQTIKGFGGAFTEASAHTLNALTKDKQNELMNAYFSSNGLKYNLGRIHMNSCDFALNNYTYIQDYDDELKTFDLSHDQKEIIPMIQWAYELTNHNLALLASPWSPPAYMKDNLNMNYGGHLLEKYKPTWAKYYVKYIQEMKKLGIDIQAISVQNEPAATQTWDSCIYSPEEERDFVKYYLGPELKKAGMEYIHLYVWDHNRGDVLVSRAVTIFEDLEAASYIYGLAFHWYCSEDFESLSKFHQMYPNKGLLFTEGCVEYGVYGDESKLRWENGEHYAHHLINDFNHYSEGFIDWNLILDEFGGPNHVGNYCEAPIMVDTKQNKIIYNASYYYIGHFSKYVAQGAKRLGSVTSSPSKTIESVSFKNPNGEIVVIIMNKGWIEEVSLIVDGNKVNLYLPNQSITTYIIK